MNNPNYGVLCDSIVNKYLIEQCGYAPFRSSQAGIIVTTHFDYFGSVGYPDTVEVGLRVVQLGRTSAVYEIGVFSKGQDMVKAVGGSTHVWVDVEENKLGRPAKEGMPSRVREGLLALRGEGQNRGAAKL
jgi:acyl-CoA thioester hydrolase